jgi:hypothetical protein
VNERRSFMTQPREFTALAKPIIMFRYPRATKYLFVRALIDINELN